MAGLMTIKYYRKRHLGKYKVITSEKLSPPKYSANSESSNIIIKKHTDDINTFKSLWALSLLSLINEYEAGFKGLTFLKFHLTVPSLYLYTILRYVFKLVKRSKLCGM